MILYRSLQRLHDPISEREPEKSIVTIVATGTDNVLHECSTDMSMSMRMYRKCLS